MTRTTLPEYVLAPLREIGTLIEARLDRARSCLGEYDSIPESPHAQDWRDQVRLLARARMAWLRFVVDEGLADVL